MARGRKLSVAVAGLAVLAACGKDPVTPVRVATANLNVPVNTNTAGVVLIGKTFSFPGGAGALSPAVAGNNLSLSIGGSATAQTAALVITSPTGAPVTSFTAALTYGSCIFTILAPGGAAPFVTGAVITVPTCNLTINTAGQEVGVPTPSTVTVTLGNSTSAPVTVQNVTISARGQVQVDGVPVGTVDTTPSTGSGGITG